MLNKIGHYALENPGSIYDEEALTSLELCARTAHKVNECVETINEHIEKCDREHIIMHEKEIPAEVRKWLDEHPEATTTVTDGSLTLPKFHKDLVNQTVNEYETPSMYGAKGDGKTDDSNAFASLIVSDKKVINLQGKTYLIRTPLNLKEGTELYNGGLILDNENSVITGSDAYLHDIVINGNNKSCFGVSLTNGNGVVIERCRLSNFATNGTSETSAITLTACENAIIADTTIENVDGKSNSIARGIKLVGCINTKVSHCNVMNILGNSDADGIHIQHEGDNEIYSNNVIEHTVVSDCQKRCVKIQQRGVIINGCLFYNVLGVSCSKCVIALYDSDIKLINCYLSHTSAQTIIVGVKNEDTDTCKSIEISGNTIIDHGTAYRGAIDTAVDCRLVKDVFIHNNRIIAMSKTTQPAITLSGYFENVLVNNNVCSYVYSLISIRNFDETTATGFPVIRRGLIVTGNRAFCYYGFVLVEQTLEPYCVTIMGNDYDIEEKPSNGSLRNTYVLLDKNEYALSRANIANNNCPDSYNDGLCKKGSTSLRPTYAPDLFTYYNTETWKVETCLDGYWYDAATGERV